MKTGVTAVVAASWLLALSAEAATEMEIATCEDLVVAAQATSSGDVLGTLTNDDISCGPWTVFEIAQNRLKLVGDTSKVVHFYNARFVVGGSGVLRADVPVDLTGDNLPDSVLNGTLLNVAKGGRARFMAPVQLQDIRHNGGMTFGSCLYNEGTVRFEDEFIADGCRNLVEAQGGAVWNGGDAGKMVFKGKSSMINCGSSVIDGGAVFNMARMTFFQDAFFGQNVGNFGGAIWNGGEIKFLKKSSTEFKQNDGGVGGHVFNLGALIFRGEAVFESGLSRGQGGAICFPSLPQFQFKPPLGVGMKFYKPVQFSNNESEGDGGAIAIAYEHVDFLPKEATYSGNTNLGSGNDEWCDDIYIDWDGESEEDGYICAPCNSPGTTCAFNGEEIACGALTCAELTFPQ